jgi:hypothetical protein
MILDIKVAAPWSAIACCFAGALLFTASATRARGRRRLKARAQ